MNLGARALARHTFSRVRPADRDGLPVAPGWLPGVGHVPALTYDMSWVCRAGDARGPLFWLQLGPGNWVIASIREEAFAVFRNRETSSGHLARDMSVLVGRSVLGVDGEAHRRMRGALNAPFTPRGLTAHKAGSLMAEVILPRVALWNGRPDIAICDETREFAVDVIFRMMGIEPHALATWRKAFETYSLALFPIPWDFPGSPYRRGSGAKRWIDGRLRAIADGERGQDPDRSLVSAMVNGRDEEGRGLDDEELIDNLRILVFAGHETTASTMAWAVLYLANDPARWKRLVDEALAADAPPTTPDALAKFPFAEGVFREALRLHPPVSFDSRLTVQPWSLFGREFPKGQVVGVALHELSRDAERYPNASQFVPERWLDRDKRPGPIETAQFGGGPHFCLGYHVAWLEAVLFLVAVAREFGARSMRPRIADGVFPKAVFMPLQRPPASARVQFVR
ncbi:MAG: cytochrome P450 [Myxococcales bacterium]|nr:cytochrome P450 [Myxococcales bacterium]